MSLIYEKKLCKKSVPVSNIGYLDLTCSTITY